MGWKEDKITQALVKRYGVEQKKAKKDFKFLIAELKKKKILKTVS